MANVMRTFIQVKNVSPKVHQHFKKWIDENPDSKYNQQTISTSRMFSDIYNIDFKDEEHFVRTWMTENVGSKWIYFELDYIDDDEILFIAESAWSLPFGFLSTLTNKLLSIDEATYVCGTFEDESYDPCGAFLFGVDGYHDVESFDEGEVDFEKLWEDDDYRGEMFTSLDQMKTDLIHSYNEYLEEMESQ